MAAPLIAAGASLVAILVVVAKWIQATASAATAFFQGVVAWFTAHKVIFSLFLFAVWIALWAGLMHILWSIARNWAIVQIDQGSNWGDFLVYLGYFDDWIDFSKIRGTLTVALTVFSFEFFVRNTVFARRIVVQFIQGCQGTFHG